MGPQPKASLLLIVVVAAIGFAIITAAQWAYPVRTTPEPEMNDRWRKWGEDMRAKLKTEAKAGTSAPALPATSTPGTRVPILPPTTP